MYWLKCLFNAYVISTILIITGSKMIWSNFTNDTTHDILELISYATSEDLDKFVHLHSLARSSYVPKQELYK